VTEIPEHLLKRSRERRAALGLGGDEGGEAAPSNTPAVASSSAPASPTAATPAAPAGRGKASAPAAPPPPKPDTAVVAAYKRRRRIPVWAMAALGLMPIWVFVYARSLTPVEQEAEGPLGMGAEIYSNCASCHGGDGGGGVGYPFTGGSVLATFPNIEDQLRFVYFGTGEYNLAGVEIPGDPNREGGPHVTGAQGVMPQFGSTAGGSLTDYELLSVVCHERYTLSGADPTAEPWAEQYETWCSEESEVFAALEAGEYTLATVDEFVEGVIAIGDAPAEGSGPQE
jgi:hypothetical protein